MNKMIIIATVVVLALAGGTILIRQSSQQTSPKDMTQTPTMMDENKTMMKDEIKDEGMMKDTAMNSISQAYVVYTPESYEAAKDTKRVLFFHATWCPTCKSANEDFTTHESSIPSGVTLLKTDYDQETALKKKYNITYQHTFVQVDANGNEVTRWSGGGTAELAANVK